MSISSKKARRVARREAREMKELEARAWRRSLCKRQPGESYAAFSKRFLKAPDTWSPPIPRDFFDPLVRA